MHPDMTPSELHQSDDEFLTEFLLGTSRTFALAIPLLTSERRRQIGLSYLLFRVADSIEDAPEGDAAAKKDLLAAVKDCLSSVCDGKPFTSASLDPANLKRLWPGQNPTGRLLLEFPRLMTIFSQMPPAIAKSIGSAITSTIAGMIRFIEASQESPHKIQVQTLPDLRLYCYVVAGIVGEMLTDVFVFHHPPGRMVHEELRRRSVGFGEFLQLINILKDSRLDAASGRVFIPVEASRESIYDLALEGRGEAIKYIHLLEKHGFPSDIVHFCRFIYLLADGSLRKLRDHGAGSKLTRDEVTLILSEVKAGCSVMPV